MIPFNCFVAIAAPLDGRDIDTDQIIPSRFLGRSRAEQVEGLFRDLRFRPDGQPDPDFALNQPRFTGAGILVASENFGGGSSRENAVTVLIDSGFRAFVAPSFGDIFRNNCFQNGALPICLSTERCSELRRQLQQVDDPRMSIDLRGQTITGPDGRTEQFEIDAFRKECLLEGVDEISMTLSHEASIAAFEAAQERLDAG